MKNIPATGFPKDLIQAVGGIPNSYLEYFYFRNEEGIIWWVSKMLCMLSDV